LSKHVVHLVDAVRDAVRTNSLEGRRWTPVVAIADARRGLERAYLAANVGYLRIRLLVVITQSRLLRDHRP
jgi:hypothetical protein